MSQSPLRVARILDRLLLSLIVLLGLGVFAMLATALIMQFPNGLRASILGKLETTGGMMPSTSQLALNSLIAAILAGAYLYVALVVKAIVKTTLQGDPFVEANISRLRKTWVIIALAEIFRMIAMGLLPVSTTHAGTTALNSFSLDTRLSAWFLVFVIATMAEVFRIGLELRRDQELTV